MRIFQFLMCRCSLVLVAAALCFSRSAVFAQETSPSGDRVTAVYADEPPRIDGVLDDAVWQDIEPITSFIQVWPDEGAEATESSEVLVAYNRDYLFFGFTFYDREPHLIRAKNLERGGRNDRDDHAYIALDTYQDKRNAYLFEINALGTQDDATITDEQLSIDSFSWDAVFRSETEINEEGWTLEVSIPFRQLRFPDDDDLSFGLMLSRTINRKNERVLWPEIGLEFGGRFGALGAVSQYGTVDGLMNVRRGKNIEIKPYIITGVQTTGPDTLRSTEHKFERDAGVDFKYGITSNATLDLSVNTDFAQIEVDNVQINLTRFSLFYPEKREFFLERAGLFDHGNSRTTQTFFSRRIGLFSRILTGGRFTGQIGPLSIGLMNIETGSNLRETFGAKSSNNTVARIRATLFPRATIGAIITNLSRSEEHILGESRNTAIGIDGQYRFWSSSEISGWFTTTNETNGDLFGAAKRSSAGHISTQLLNDTYGGFLSYTGIGRYYFPALGFVRRWDQRRYRAAAQYTPILEVSALPFFRQVGIEGEYVYITGQDGETQTTSVEINFEAQGHQRDQVELSYRRFFERLDSPFFLRDTSVPQGDYIFSDFSIQGETDSSRPLYGEALFRTGGFFSGTETRVEGSVGFRQSRHLSMEAEVGYSMIDLPTERGRFDATTYSFSVLAALNRKLFATVLVQYDNFSNLLLTNIRINWIHTPGSDLFLVFNSAYEYFDRGAPSWAPDSRRLLWDRVSVAKLTYLILL